MIVAGVMSGTSADGVDVAVCRIRPGLRKGAPPRVKLIGLLSTPYPKAVRAAVLRVMEGKALPAAEMSRLNWRLGEIYADCVERASAKFAVKVALVGCHGQTVHHEAVARRVLGAAVRSTWQMGEAAAIAERMHCPVVSDFRPADLAAGGQGAPLVPMLDWCLFRDAKRDRVLLNVGGIANLTWLPAGCGLDDVKAFDTGPGNMVIDGCMQRLYDDARLMRMEGLRARGRASEAVVKKVMAMRYFSAPPPKSFGREVFGAVFAERFLAMCKGARKEDVIATATALTAESVGLAFERFCWTGVKRPAHMLVGGGGARNATLMRMMASRFAKFGVRVAPLEKVGMAAQAKEGVAFALLAWLTWHGMAGNVPAATGAKRALWCWGRFRTDDAPNWVCGRHGKSEMRGFFPSARLRVRMTILRGIAGVVLALGVIGCHGAAREPGTVVVLLESSPNNLDPRQGTDAQSERVGPLIFDALVKKDEHYNLQPWLATSWEQPDALTWVFHLRDGVRFQDGRPLEAADVVWTIESLIDPKLGLAGRIAGQFQERLFRCGRPSRGARPAHGRSPHETARCGAALQHERWTVRRGTTWRWQRLWDASGGVGAVPLCEPGAGQRRSAGAFRRLLEQGAERERRGSACGDPADSVQRGAGYDYQCAGVAEGLRRRGQ